MNNKELKPCPFCGEFCRRFKFKMPISFYTKPRCEQGKEEAEL